MVAARWLANTDDQSYIGDAAELLANALFDPALGACEPALEGIRVLHDPTRVELTMRMRQAFEVASQTGSTLVICLVGHGYTESAQGPYHFLPSDHPASYNTVRTDGYPLAECITELNARYANTDGLILLVDTCRSGKLWQPDLRHWALPIHRLAVATATGAGFAWNARFTRSIAEAMESGIDEAGPFLKVGDFIALMPRENRQQSHHFSYADSDDVGLWISSNRLVRLNEVEHLVWQVNRRKGLYRLTERYQRPEIPDRVAETIARHRTVAVLGPSGCGKSARLQMIAIDGLQPSRLGAARAPVQRGKAVAFFPAAADTTPDYFAEQLHDQIDRCLRGEFGKAQQAFLATMTDEQADQLPATQRWLTGPLRYLSDGFAVLLVIDGLDQLPETTARNILSCLTELSDARRYERVQVVVSARHRPGNPYPELPAGFATVTMPHPTPAQIRRYLRRRRVDQDRLPEIEAVAAGNWLIITLLCNRLTSPGPEPVGGLPNTLEELYDELLGEVRSSEPAAWASGFAPVLAILTCAGPGVALPLEVLRAGSAELGAPGSVPAVRSVVVALNRLVERIEPGTVNEQLMLIHPTLAEHLVGRAERWHLPNATVVHSAVASVLATLAPMGGNRDGEPDPIRAYAERGEAAHRWAAGDVAGLVNVLIGRTSTSARENRDRWELWSHQIVDLLGPAHQLGLQARQQLAFWTSRCGMFSDALRQYGVLLPEVVTALGPDDPLVHRTSFDEAMCVGVNGRPGEARDRLRELVPRMIEVSGANSELALEARHALGVWTGLAGNPHGAVAQLRPVLADYIAYLEPDHPETLACRHSLARWTGESGEAARAVDEFRALLPAQRRRLGERHRETLRTRYSIAYWSGEAGRPQETLRLFRELITVQREALGEEHPDTLRTQHGIGLWTGVTGDPAGAVRVLAELLPVRERVLGPDHPDTLRTRNNLGRWTGALGRYQDAIEILEDALERRTRTLGKDHPDTMRTMNNIIDWTGANGAYDRAYELATELLPLQRRVLGERHQDTLRTRFNQARWLAASGEVAAALTALEVLYADQVDVLGSTHPDALRTESNLADLRADGAG